MSRSLPIGVLLTYGASSAGMAYMSLLVGLYLMKFATDVLLIPPATMGLVFGCALLLNALTGPVVGFLSDRTRTRLGRRRPWILGAILPTGAVFVMMWSPPASLSGSALVAWMGITTIVFYVSQAVYNVPHLALGAELAVHYHDRDRVFAARHFLAGGGCLLTLFTISRLITSSDPRRTAFELAAVAAGATALLLLLTGSRLRERIELVGRGAPNPVRAFRDVLRNPHGRLLLAVLFAQNLGLAAVAILTPYAAQYLVGAPEHTASFMLAFMAPSALMVPVWPALSRRVGKRNLWLLGLTLLGAASLAFLRLSKGDVALFAVSAAVAGVAAGCFAMLVPSVQADVVDWDEYATGERKEGAYYSSNILAVGLATGLTLAASGLVLQWAGFRPNADQPASVDLALRCLFGAYPAVTSLATAALLWRFRLDEAEHRAIRAQTHERL